MELNPDLAQKIVKKTMDVLGKNINIMNRKGIIIASGDRSRVNTFHEVAARVVKERKSLIIKEGEADQYQGVRPGINLPIRFNEDIIGVVGITGKADEVAGYGKIVKNMVELMLQQEFLRRDIELENKARENFYQQLLSNSIYDKELIKDKAELLKINPDLFRVVLVIEIQPFDNKVIANEVQYFYNSPYIKNDEDIFLIRGENLVLIKSLNTSKPKLQNKEIIEVTREIEERFTHKISVPVIGVGQIFYGLDKLYLSYQGAKHALNVGKKIARRKDNVVFYINRLGFDYFLPLIDPSSSNYYLHHLFDRDITQIFSEKDTGLIIEALVDNDLNISKTAEQLFIHRNTLLYRLTKIKEKTGLDPKKARDLFNLLWIYHLYLYTNQS